MEYLHDLLGLHHFFKTVLKWVHSQQIKQIALPGEVHLKET
jgi:hypothetical protein